MEITKDYLESLKLTCQKKIEKISYDPYRNSLEKRAKKKEIYGLTCEIELIDSLIARLEREE